MQHVFPDDDPDPHVHPSGRTETAASTERFRWAKERERKDRFIIKSIFCKAISTRVMKVCAYV